MMIIVQMRVLEKMKKMKKLVMKIVNIQVVMEQKKNVRESISNVNAKMEIAKVKFF